MVCEMRIKELQAQISLGEDSKHQFKADIARINQLISNAASQLVKSPLAVRTEKTRSGPIPRLIT